MIKPIKKVWGFPGGSVVRNLPVNARTWVQSLVLEDPHAAGQLSLCTTTKGPML